MHFLTRFYGIAPLVTFLVVSLVFDYLILRFVRGAVYPTSQTEELDIVTRNAAKNSSYEVIPARATGLSALTLVCFVLQ